MLAQPLLVKGFAEPTAVIDMPFGNDDLRKVRCNCRLFTHAGYAMTAFSGLD